jgi:HK97 family phage portal protein
MRFFGKDISFRKASGKEIQNAVSINSGGSPYRLLSRETPLLLSAVYRCVDCIGDAVAQLPFETYTCDDNGYRTLQRMHPAYHLLNYEPNADMTRFTFLKLMICSMLLHGNAYAYIDRNPIDGSAQSIVYLPDHSVDVVWITDSAGIRRKRYQVTYFSELVEPKDMIHLLNYTPDGITGISTLSYARNSILVAQYNESYAAGFFESGSAGAGVLGMTNTPRLSKEQKEDIRAQWREQKNGGLIILEGTQTYSPITVSPKDAQMLESREYSVIDICRFFGVSPVKAFDLSKSSYSTIEATELAFLTDTVAPILAKFEQEFTRKMFTYLERGKMYAGFNVDSLLKADKATQASYYGRMVQNGVLTRNEVRRMLGMNSISGGDEALVQVNMQLLSEISKNNTDATKPTETKKAKQDGAGRKKGNS